MTDYLVNLLGFLIIDDQTNLLDFPMTDNVVNSKCSDDRWFGRIISEYWLS